MGFRRARIHRATLRTATLTLTAIGVLLMPLLVAGSAPTSASPVVTTIKMGSPKPYKPHAPPGGTDDYHCTLVNPHVTSNSFIISSQFYAHSAEVHHAIVFLVPPDLAAQAEADNKNDNGWTCFGETPLPGTDALDHITDTPWLSAWAPGHGEDVEPAGTGVPLPAGSLIVLQVHYNLLVGDSPVKVAMDLHTVPASTPLRPLTLTLMPAPPDVPCPADVTGPLCNRNAELANLGKQFGESQVQFVNTIESVCGRNPQNPPEGDSTSCTWPIGKDGYIVRVGAHMHLTGVSFRMILNPGTPQAQTILNVPDYNFHYQRAYNIKPVAVVPSDRLEVSCTYNPKLAQELPILRRVPPHFIMWGDGSADEMCLGLVQTIPPNSVPESVARTEAFNAETHQHSGF